MCTLLNLTGQLDNDTVDTLSHVSDVATHLNIPNIIVGATARDLIRTMSARSPWRAQFDYLHDLLPVLSTFSPQPDNRLTLARLDAKQSQRTTRAEAKLLYVAMTRATDKLLITAHRHSEQYPLPGDVFSDSVTKSTGRPGRTSELRARYAAAILLT